MKFEHIINVTTQGLQRGLMLQQMQENMLHQVLQVRVANDTEKVQSIDWRN